MIMLFAYHNDANHRDHTMPWHDCLYHGYQPVKPASIKYTQLIRVEISSGTIDGHGDPIDGFIRGQKWASDGRHWLVALFLPGPR